MKDRVVQNPNRYKLTLVPGTTDTYDLVAVPGIITEQGTALNKANLLSDITAALYGLSGSDATVNNALASCQLATKAYGRISYTDTIPQGSADIYTKNIAIGAGKRFGVCVIRHTESISTLYDENNNGIMVFFTTNNLKTKAAGYVLYGSGSGGGAICREHYGAITTGTAYGFGGGVLGNEIQLMDLYISGSNIVIKYTSINTSSARSLKCTIDWEVW